MSESQDTKQRDAEQDDSEQDEQRDAEQTDHEREPDPNSEERDAESRKTVVPGVDTDPDSKKKSIVVDTNQRLEEKDHNRDDVPDDQLEQERKDRLDPEKRPDNTEVDNSDRTFNPETGLFEDTDLEPPEDAPYSTTEAEQSNSDTEEGEGSTSDSDDSEEAESEEAGSEDTEDSKEAKESEESKDTES